MTDDATKTILVADDERPMRLLMRATLSGQGYRLLMAEDGGEALRLTREERPDLVLLDVGMPRLDGLAVCRALKGDPATAGIPVVMVTAHAQAGDRGQGAGAGADGYLTKPFSPAELLRAVEGLLRRS